MSMTLQQIRDFVRNHLDLTSSDLPDAVVDVFIREGFNHAMRGQVRWPWLEKTYSLNTVNGTRSYTFASIGADLEDIVHIEGPRYVYQRVDHDDAENTWPSSILTTSEPAFWSKWESKLYLWPTPNAAYTLAIRGYRSFTDWTTLGTSTPPDCPYDFHEPIAFWALGRAYQQQDDLFNADTYAQTAEQMMQLVRSRYIHAPQDRPIVMNRGRRRYGLPVRLRYPFDNA